MSESTFNRLNEEAWQELERAMGGRFKDGVECPYVLDLFNLAFEHKEENGMDTQRLLEHIEVCSVCCHKYRAALVAANKEVSGQENLAEVIRNAFLDKSTASSSMLDEFLD